MCTRWYQLQNNENGWFTTDSGVYKILKGLEGFAACILKSFLHAWLKTLSFNLEVLNSQGEVGKE